MALLPAPPAQAAGVTLITHGHGGNVAEWVIPMCDRIPRYAGFPGTNVSSYELSITRTGSVYYATPTFREGVSPTASDSGEILIALDWSTLASGTVSTSVIATQAVAALLSPTLLADLGGRPLSELPLHLVGHSRGASVVAEMARLLAYQGVWVDQLTTLDPYPTALFGDPAMVLCANVLFVDNYWQNLGFPNGRSLFGAYNRQLTSLNGGYSSTHSDVHLWYHGTIDLVTPTTDTQAPIDSTMRSTWWTALEAAGTNAGFRSSRLAGGNRLSNLEPNGAGNGRISDGMNKLWDFGAGLAANRTRTADNGSWPNLIRLDRTGSGPVPAGQPVPLACYYQSGLTAAGTASFEFFLDPDANPYNGNESSVLQTTLANTGTNNVYLTTLDLSPNPATTLPGTYFVYARVSNASHSRCLYAPQPLVLTPSQQAPVLLAAAFQTNQFRCTVAGAPGQTVVVEASTNFLSWLPLQTNTLGRPATWRFSDPASASVDHRFYRASLAR